MQSWVPIDEASGFSLENLPYGIFSTQDRSPRPGVPVGDFILDLHLLADNDVFTDCDFDTTTLADSTLNRYAALGRSVHRQVRSRLHDILRIDTTEAYVLRDNRQLREQALVPKSKVQMHLPMFIGDYTDFFTSPYHAENCMDIFHPGEAVAPAFFRQPLGYGGRASSIVVSGTKVYRPNGQHLSGEELIFGPCQSLDYEVEFAAFVGRGNNHGVPIKVEDAEDHVFGFVLMNDWSARDVQRFESNPLGPLNGKNFATTISPWIVTPDALEPYRSKVIPPGPLLSYLDESEHLTTYDIPLEAHIEVEGKLYQTAQCNTRNTCFSFAQMIAHHTAGGCPLQPGDLIGTGTLSGSTRSELGCLLEANLGGKRKCRYRTEDGKDFIDRDWLQDVDAVHITARLKSKHGPGFIDFGSCSGQILESVTR